MEPVLQIRELSVEFPTESGPVRPVDSLSLDIAPGETLGVVGESGAGKSMTALAIVGLVPAPGRIVGGRIMFEGRDVLTMTRVQLRRLRGSEIAMVFQDPMNSLNPVFTVGHQIDEAIWAHDRHSSRSARRKRVLELMDLVGLPNPARQYRRYPLELSGGMRQRVMIAMAIANRPRLIIADEPTTALDVTIQAQVLEVLRTVHVETGAALMLITHDLGLIAEMASRVVVMYAGRPVELGDVMSIFDSPRHPYTAGLLGSLPGIDDSRRRLVSISGQPPRLGAMPTGCAFHPRCSLSGGREICTQTAPPLQTLDDSRAVACHFHEETLAAAVGPPQEGA